MSSATDDHLRRQFSPAEVKPGLCYAIQILEQVLNRGQNGAIGAGLAIAIVELKMEIEKL